MSQPLHTIAGSLNSTSVGFMLVRSAQEELILAAHELEIATRGGCPVVLRQALVRMAQCFRERGLADVAEGYQQQAEYWARQDVEDASVISEEIRLLRHLTDIAMAQALLEVQSLSAQPAQRRASTGASEQPVWLPDATTRSGGPSATT